MKLLRNLTIIVILLIKANDLWAGSLVYGAKEGYISDVVSEKYLIVYEIPMVHKPTGTGKSLNKILFDPKLTKEFKVRYEQNFGFTDIQRNFNAPNQFAEQEYQPGVWVTPQEDQDRRQAYGNYVVKRLTEHHMDLYFKSNPKVRPIYELKDKISNVDLEVSKGYKVHMRYSYSGNFLNLTLDNPYDIRSRLTLEMDPNSVGPTEILETRMNLSIDVTPVVSVSTDYTFNDGDLTLIGSRKLNKQLYATVTGVADTRSGTGVINQDNTTTVTNLNYESEKRILVGLSWSN